MHISRLLSAVCACTLTFINTTASAALVDNGGGLIYETVLDITWAQPEGLSTWYDAETWAAGLTLSGVSGWRLPYISVAAGTGPFTGTPVDCATATEVACRDNELGYMFFQNLGGTLGSSILTSGDPDLALFPTLQANLYRSGTEYGFGDAWVVQFHSGYQGLSGQGLAWAVHAGNIGAIPVPAAVWLFGSGLVGLIGIARRKNTA